MCNNILIRLSGSAESSPYIELLSKGHLVMAITSNTPDIAPLTQYRVVTIRGPSCFMDVYIYTYK